MRLQAHGEIARGWRHLERDVLSWAYVVVQGVGVENTGSAGPVGTHTLAGMPSRATRLDHRSLQPQKYLTNGLKFGDELDPELVVPAGGNRVSLQVALVQHRLVYRLRHPRDPKLAAAVKKKFGFSLSSWYRCLRGEAWMGETVQAALVGALLDTLPATKDEPRQVPSPRRHRKR